MKSCILPSPWEGKRGSGAVLWSLGSDTLFSCVERWQHLLKYLQIQTEKTFLFCGILSSGLQSRSGLPSCVKQGVDLSSPQMVIVLVSKQSFLQVTSFGFLWGREEAEGRTKCVRGRQEQEQQRNGGKLRGHRW